MTDMTYKIFVITQSIYNPIGKPATHTLRTDIIQFDNRLDADTALASLNGTRHDGLTVLAVALY